MTNQGEQISSIQSTHLDLPPSCLEFCPIHPSYFLVGTYNLQKNDAPAEPDDQDEHEDKQKDEEQLAKAKLQSRNGTILVFNLVEGRFSHVQTEEQPSALLDLRFNPNAGKEDICAAVSSTSTLALFKLDPSLDRPLRHIKTMDMTTMSNGALTPEPGTEVLFLAFAWHPSRADMVAITTNTGHVYIVDLGGFNGNWEMHSEPVMTHDLEAWCITIAPCIDPAVPFHEKAFVLYSGGDDSILRSQTCVVLEQEQDQEPEPDSTRCTIDCSLPPSKLRGHDAGVTAILPLPSKAGKPSLVVTGSYDDHIRLFSLSSASPYSPLRAHNLAERNLGGGVWRLKLIDIDDEPGGGGEYLWRARILASCMHAGTRVVELVQTSDGEYSFRTVGRFEEHQSMNYGSDFHPGSVEQKKLTVVSSSFYDKLMCLWEMEL
ncbi:hypothetical protein V8F20_008236 [Naviculisporaceae sp. PSN 640]